MLEKPDSTPSGRRQALVDETLSRLSLRSPVVRNEPQEKTSSSIARKRRRADKDRASDLNPVPSTPLRVFTFGSGEYCELGLGVRVTSKGSPLEALYPRLNTLLGSGVVQISVGGMHCAALMRDGKVYTWGINDSKALGRDTTWQEPDEPEQGIVDLNPLESTPMPVEHLGYVGPIAQVAATDNATFVLTSAGHVHGWGTFFGDDGPFGFQVEKDKEPGQAQRFSPTPVRINGLDNVKELATGVNHLLALTHDGAVYSCGSGHQAELGRRIIPRRPYAALEARPILPSRWQIVRIYAGFNHSFAIDIQGRVWSWGLNNFGQTGHGITDHNAHIVEPGIVKSLENLNIREIAPGFHHTILCTYDGSVYAWGRCDDRQLGMPLSQMPREYMVMNGDRPRAVSAPIRIPGIKATFVAAGIDNSFAVTNNGDVYAWGFSENYRTGLGTEDSVATPTLLRGADFQGCKIVFAGCGGQFSVVAGTPP